MSLPSLTTPISPARSTEWYRRPLDSLHESRRRNRRNHREVAVLAARTEAAGLESVWLAELDRTALVQAAAAISATSRIGVGTAVALACRERPWRSPLDPAQVQLKALLPSRRSATTQLPDGWAQ